MPSVNIYTSKENAEVLSPILHRLRGIIAKELSVKERELNINEVSIRILVPVSSMQIADTEVEIKAHIYQERVVDQDKICLFIKDYIQKSCPKVGSVYVWLQLSELGHSGN